MPITKGLLTNSQKSLLKPWITSLEICLYQFLFFKKSRHDFLFFWLSIKTTFSPLSDAFITRSLLLFKSVRALRCERATVDYLNVTLLISSSIFLVVCVKSAQILELVWRGRNIFNFFFDLGIVSNHCAWSCCVEEEGRPTSSQSGPSFSSSSWIKSFNAPHYFIVKSFHCSEISWSDFFFLWSLSNKY